MSGERSFWDLKNDLPNDTKRHRGVWCFGCDSDPIVFPVFTSMDGASERVERLAMVYGAVFAIMSAELGLEGFDDLIEEMNDHKGCLTVVIRKEKWADKTRFYERLKECFKDMWSSPLGNEERHNVELWIR